MRKIERLKHEALKVCKEHNHSMERFFRPYLKIEPPEYVDYWRSYCKICGWAVEVSEKSIIFNLTNRDCPFKVYKGK
jgi:hypothetical protein